MQHYGRPKINLNPNKPGMNKAGKNELNDPLYQCLFGGTMGNNHNFTIDDKEAYERELFGHTLDNGGK